MRGYLSKKYQAYSKDPKHKVFTSDHVRAELLCSPSVATLSIKEALGRRRTMMNFDQFAEVIEASLR